MFTAASLTLGLGWASTARAQSVDFIRQEVFVDLATPGMTTVDLELELVATGSVTKFSTANPAIPITSVLVNGAPGTFAPHPTYPEYLTEIRFPGTFAAGDTIAVSIQMSGVPSCGASALSCSSTPDETLFTFPSPGSAWYHVDPFKVDPFIGSVELRVPVGYVAVAGHGKLREIITESPEVERHAFDFVAPTEVFGGYAAKGTNVATMESQGGFPTKAIYPLEEAKVEEVTRAVDVASRVIPVLTEHYGPLAIEGANLVTVPKNFAFGAMSTLGVVYVNEVVFTTETYLVEQGMAHETSHFWWGNTATAELANEGPFFGESMAEYSGWRALGELDGVAKRTAGMRMNAVWYMYRRPNDADMDVLTGDQSNPAFVHVVYHKGPLVLRTLEEYVGSEAFGAVLKDSINLGLGGLSVDRLVEDVAAATGIDINPLVEEWLRAQGFPRIAVTARVGDESIELSFDQPSYTLRVPVDLVDVRGGRTQHIVDLEPGASTVSLPLPAAGLAAVEIDPLWTMVREIASERAEDVTLDGVVDGADLIEVALRHGTSLPSKRRVDGSYDPLFDVEPDRKVDDADLARVISAAP
ncbi:MAG: hypothetical protein HOV80_19780 [Polyangiaceae bacterium]|nr:hypothetical protein [Polyangiaceae bacterium]